MENKRNTKQKQKIIEYLKNNQNTHLTIKQIKESIDQNIGLTTVYRLINDLIKQGSITKTSLNNKQGFCYQYNETNENCKSHYHLICKNCGIIHHFSSEKFEKTILEAKEKDNFIIDNSKVVFYGECESCQKENKN